MANQERRRSRVSVTGVDAWTEAEERALRVEYRRGYLLDDLAAMHGRAVHDVRSRLIRLGEFDRAFRRSVADHPSS